MIMDVAVSMGWLLFAGDSWEVCRAVCFRKAPPIFSPSIDHHTRPWRDNLDPLADLLYVFPHLCISRPKSCRSNEVGRLCENGMSYVCC